MAAQAAPNRNAKTTTCSTSLRAMASMMLAGKTCSRMAPSVAGGACVAPNSAPPAPIGTPSPGRAQVHRREAQEQGQGGDDFK